MARIDSILGIVRQQGANELRVGVDREPRMFAGGVRKKLSIPATSEETLRTLLGEILSPEREAEMRTRGSAQMSYDAGPLGTYSVTLTARDAGFEVVLLSATALVGQVAPPAAAQPLKPALPEARSGNLAPRAQPPLPAAPVQPQAPPAPIAERPPLTAATASDRLEQLLRRAIALTASDLHLAERETPFVRVDGTLARLDAHDDEPIEDLAALLPLDSAMWSRVRGGDSVDLALEVPGAGRVRVHVYPSASGPVAAIRLLPPAAPSFASLNMPFAFDDLIDLPHGLVLVCGAAGSGKSTTLAALAEEALHRRSLVLVTLEDPIEYTLTPSPTSLLRRRQIGRDVRDFATGLRDSLRADPELLLLGELRDPETIALALTAAETGHLVLASMHSGSAASAVERIIDAFPAARQQQVRLQLAESLRAIVAQRLLRRARGEGRIPAVEVLRVTRAVASLIREGRTAQIASALQSGRREGMIALERCLADRVQAGEVRLEDAYAAANDSETLAIFLSR
jgi:twitching motility protein PilT